MSLEGLREAILSEARRTADELMDTAQQQTASEEKRILQRAKKIEEDIIREAELEGTQKAGQLRQGAELTGRANVLRAKEEEMEQTRQALLKHVYTQDASALVESLLTLVPDEAGTIIPGEKHLKEVTKAARGMNIASKPIPDEGGFIFRGKTTELNVTISHLVDRLFKKHRAEIASILFS